MMDPILSFEGVSFGYSQNGKAVMTDFCLHVPSGSVTAILGPNGAGKTTLLHLALGWLKPRRGNIYLKGRGLREYSRRELGQWMGLVPQTEYISFDFSLLEYVLLGRAPYLRPLDMPTREDVQIALRSLEQVGLNDLHHRSVLNLSGGERQLLLTARAITQQPRFLLLDEPSSHLDISNKVRLLNLLRELSRQDVTIMLTTHEPEFASAIATHLVLMREGKVQEAGALEEEMTSEKLSALYGTSVKVVKVDGKSSVLWG